jgi:DNA-binding NarL/FixJ family response regulator
VSRRVPELRRSPAKRRINVVLVDDDRGFVESLRTLVDDQPQLSVVGIGGDGLDAIELVEELGPEAVVIDLHMPRLDGVSAVARIRQDHPALCLIAITGDDAPELHQAVADAGADAVLMKHEIFDGLADQIFTARERVTL